MIVTMNGVRLGNRNKKTRLILFLSGYVIGTIMLTCFNRLSNVEESKPQIKIIKDTLPLLAEDTYIHGLGKDKDKIPLFSPPTSEEKENFLKKPDESTFGVLIDAFMYENFESEGLLYALVAANKFNIPRGNVMVYFYLTNNLLSGKTPITETDKRTDSIAQYYLKKGAACEEAWALTELNNKNK